LAPNAVIAGHTIDNDEAFRSISLAIDYIQKNIQRPISLNEVAQRAYLSPSYLSRLFKKYLHVNFIEYVNNQKIALAQEKLSLT
ncbi:AraC family transcriptional regulator, partial [Mycobacterium kansasii]